MGGTPKCSSYAWSNESTEAYDIQICLTPFSQQTQTFQQRTEGSNSTKTIEKEGINALHETISKGQLRKKKVHTRMSFVGSVSKFPKYKAPPTKPANEEGMATALSQELT